MTHQPPIITQLTAGMPSESEQATLRLATDLAPHVPADTVLALHGDLGVGKTTFVRGLAKAWGIHQTITSPSYNLYTIYSGTRQLIHFDAYRLSSQADLDALMIDDFMKAPWCFAVEWPERIIEALPPETWHLHLAIEADGKHSFHLRLPGG